MEAVVEYNYVAQEPDELTLRKGDIITEIKVMLGGWWEGTLRDKRGMFPDNFVKVLERSSTGIAAHTRITTNDTASGGNTEEQTCVQSGGSGKKWCKVLFSYEPCRPDELTLVPGDRVEFLGEVEQGWWKGCLKGQMGVFPSNFVAPPVHNELDKHTDYATREYCRVLYSYTAANEDELSLTEGDIVTILSKDALDKGWWKGELRGQIGLFPDNFVEIIGGRNEHIEQEPRIAEYRELKHDVTDKSCGKHMHEEQPTEKPHMKRNFDIASFPTDVASSMEISKKTISGSSSSSALSALSGTVTNSGDNIKHLRGSPTAVDNSNERMLGVAFDVELDGVERGEGAPLSHLTASRAKAPRRRPPSSQRLRLRHVDSSSNSVVTTTLMLENNLTNGSIESTLEKWREEDTNEGVAFSVRKKTPWAQELKLNQLERRRVASVDCIDKSEGKQERSNPRLSSLSSVDTVIKSEPESEETKPKDTTRERVRKPEVMPHGIPTSPTTYVPYALYSQLLQRVAALEENQATLQRTVAQFSEQLSLLLANTSESNKD